jgi:hypothetical protein
MPSGAFVATDPACWNWDAAWRSGSAGAISSLDRDPSVPSDWQAETIPQIASLEEGAWSARGRRYAGRHVKSFLEKPGAS